MAMDPHRMLDRADLGGGAKGGREVGLIMNNERKATETAAMLITIAVIGIALFAFIIATGEAPSRARKTPIVGTITHVHLGGALHPDYSIIRTESGETKLVDGIWGEIGDKVNIKSYWER